MPDFLIEDQLFTYVSYLDKGNYGKTYIYQFGNKKYVFKFFYPTKKASSSFKKEEITLQQIKNLLHGCHEHIICYQYVLSIDPDDINYQSIYDNLLDDKKKLYDNLPIHCIVSDYINGTNLELFMEEHENINEKEWGRLIRTFISKMLEIIKLLHSLDIVHRDIKPANIIVTRKNNKYEFSLVDLGGSCIKNCENHYGSVGFFSLKLLAMEKNDITLDSYKLQDIYCLYICIYMLANNRNPFIGVNKFINKDDNIDYYIDSDSPYEDINKILNNFFYTYIEGNIKTVYKKLNIDNLQPEVENIINNFYHKNSLMKKINSIFRT